MKYINRYIKISAFLFALLIIVKVISGESIPTYYTISLILVISAAVVEYIISKNTKL